MLKPRWFDIQNFIDELRAARKWDDVKRHQKQYMKNVKQGKTFKSKFRTKEDQIAYAETVDMHRTHYLFR